MEIFKILAVCLITAIFAIVLKEYRGDYALVLVLAGGVTVTCFLLKSIVTPIGYLKQLFPSFTPIYDCISGINQFPFRIAFGYAPFRIFQNQGSSAICLSNIEEYRSYSSPPISFKKSSLKIQRG